MVGAKMRQLQEPGWRRPRNPLSRLPKKPAMPNMPPNKRAAMPGPAGPPDTRGRPLGMQASAYQIAQFAALASPLDTG